MSRGGKYHALRHPKTAAERRESEQVDTEYDQQYCNRRNLIRAKRRWRNIPSDWDDNFHEYQKSWKKFRRDRYYNTQEKTRPYTVIVNFYCRLILQEYFRDHNIRYRYFQENNSENKDLWRIVWFFHKDIGVEYILGDSASEFH